MNKFWVAVPVVVIALGAALFILIGGNQPLPQPQPQGLPNLTGNTVNSSGGIMTLQDGAVKLAFPQGALQGNTEITVADISSTYNQSFLIPGTSFRFGPNGINFSKPVQLAIKYDQSKLPGTVSETQLRIAKVGELSNITDWVLVDGCEVNTSSNIVSCNITGFSDYSVVVVDTNMRGKIIMDDSYTEWANSPNLPHEDVGASFLLKPSGTIYVEAGNMHDVIIYVYYYDDHGVLGMATEYLTFSWKLVGDIGIIDGLPHPASQLYDQSGNMVWSDKWMPYRFGVRFSTHSLNPQAGTEGKILFRWSLGYGYNSSHQPCPIIGEAEIPIKIISGTALGPNPAYCDPGGSVAVTYQFPHSWLTISPSNPSDPDDPKLGYVAWETSGTSGKLLDTQNREVTRVAAGGSTVTYVAAENSAGGVDTIRGSLYINGLLKETKEIQVRISEKRSVILSAYQGTSLYPPGMSAPKGIYNVKNGTSTLIECEVTGKPAGKKGVFVWTCTSDYGYLDNTPTDPAGTKTVETTNNDIIYVCNSNARDKSEERIEVTYYLIENGTRVPFGNDTITLRVYNPLNRVYVICDRDSTGGGGVEWRIVGVPGPWERMSVYVNEGSQLWIRIYNANSDITLGDIFATSSPYPPYPNKRILVVAQTWPKNGVGTDIVVSLPPFG